MSSLIHFTRSFLLNWVSLAHLVFPCPWCTVSTSASLTYSSFLSSIHCLCPFFLCICVYILWICIYLSVYVYGRIYLCVYVCICIMHTSFLCGFFHVYAHMWNKCTVDVRVLSSVEHSVSYPVQACGKMAYCVSGDRQTCLTVHTQDFMWMFYTGFMVKFLKTEQRKALRVFVL